jgi:hypothetical protein
MIVLSVGMPRAGSGWHYNLIHDLMRTTNCAEAANIRTRFHLKGVLTEVNCNIGVLSARRLAMVAFPAILGNTFVIKAHAKATLASRLLRLACLMRITYIYRDPRDAMLSAMDYGGRGLEKGRPNAFSHLTDFQQALDFMLEYARIWKSWMRESHVLVTRYEDLLRDYDTQLIRLCAHLRLDINRASVREVVERNRPQRAEGRQGTHFYKGRIGRFREIFSPEQQAILADKFGPFLGPMGYPV